MEHRPGKKRRLLDPVQWLAVDLLTRHGGFVEAVVRGRPFYLEEHRGAAIVLGSGRGGYVFQTAYRRGVGGPAWESLVAYRPRPLVVVDFTALAWHRHGSEYSSLRRQTGSVLGAVREYLWDAHLVLTSLPPGAGKWLEGFMASKWVVKTSLHAEEYLSSLGVPPSRVIALDPGAEEPLTGRDVVEAEAFILGGIVDKIPWKNLTGMVLEVAAPRAERRKILLRGSSVGVPHRLNILVSILLSARYRYCGGIEKAIVEHMARRDKRMRLHRELLLATKGGRKPATRSLFEELSKWLPITWRDYVAVAKTLGVRVEEEK